MTISSLNIFESGTLASVSPVNENFETLRVAVNTVEQSVTSNRTYLDNKITEINSAIKSEAAGAKTSGEIFCINKGVFDVSGNPSILSASGDTLYLNASFSGTNVKGEVLEVTSLITKSLTGYADGVYNVFIDMEKEVSVLANTIYRQATQPTATLNTVWLNISQRPLAAKIYTAEGWEDFLQIPVGTVTVSGGIITQVTTNPYNQNGYSLNTNSNFPMPDLTKGINLAAGVSYTASSSGWLYVYCAVGSANSDQCLYVDGACFHFMYAQFAGSAFGSGSSLMFPVAKGSSFIVSGANAFIFYPTRIF